MSNKSQRPTLIIVRGLPNTGKTTLATTLVGAANVVSANQFLVKKAGEALTGRDFEASHIKCQNTIRAKMQERVPLLAVANTFTRRREYQEYLKMANENGYCVTFMETKTHFPGNVNNVPRDVVKKYAERWEPVETPIIGGFKFN